MTVFSLAAAKFHPPNILLAIKFSGSEASNGYGVWPTLL